MAGKKQYVIVTFSATRGVSVQGPYEDEEEAEETRMDDLDNNSGEVNLIVELRQP
jgi:hypothetical protein